MDEPERVDLSPLDPELLPGWNDRLARLTAHAVESRTGVVVLLARWRRPLLVAAAAAALLLIVVRPRPPAPRFDPDAALMRWALAGHIPTAAEVYANFRGEIDVH